MNPQSFVEAKRLFDSVKNITSKIKNVEVVVAPPAIFLRTLSHSYRGTKIEFGIQNVFWEHEGSYTGETSAAQAHDAGATYAIIGHAERRIQGVTDTQVNDKVLESLREKLDPIIAVGEREQDSEGEYIREVRAQIVTALTGVPINRFKNITIAYEPIWSIGAPEAPSASEVHQMMLLVRKTIRDAFGEKAMKDSRVIYGGAVNDENAEEIFQVPDLDGVLVGRAGLDPFRLDKILRAAENS